MFQELLGLAVFFAAGSVGFLLFKVARLPVAALLGPMAASVALNMLDNVPQFSPGPVAFISAVTIGLVLGKQINRRVLCQAGSMARPVLVQVSGLLLLSLACGYIFYLLTAPQGVSLGTALISSSAGGLTEMLIFGLSIGGDVALITFLQLFRIVTFLSLLPYSAKLAVKLGDKRARPPGQTACPVLPAFLRCDYVLLVMAAFAGGYAGLRLHIPAGSVLGAMFFCGMLAVILNKKYDYKNGVRYLAQIGLGLVMGQRIAPDIFQRLPSLFLPVACITAVMLVGCLFLAFLQYKTTDCDLTTCLLCSSPAGISQVALYAAEAGADVFIVSVFHTARLISIVLIYPWLIIHII